MSQMKSSDQARSTNFSATLELAHYADIVRKRWPLALSILAGCLLVSALYTLRAKKLYRTNVSIVVSQKAPQILSGVQDVVPVGAGAYFDEAFLQTEYRVISSRAVAELAAEKLNLRLDDKHNGLGQIEDAQKREKRRAEFDPVKMVQDLVQINPARRSQIVGIEVTHEDPQFAANLANAVATSYMELNVGKRLEGAKEASSWLGVQNQDLKKKLNQSEDLLYTFMEQNGILSASIDSQMDEIKSRLQQFNEKLAEVQAKRIEGKTDANALMTARENPGLLDSLPEIQNATVINTLKTKLTELLGQRSELAERYLSAHPKLKGLDEQIETIKVDLKREIDATVQRMERDQEALAANEIGLKAAIDAEREREAKMNHLAVEYNRLKRDVDTNSKMYDMVTGRLKEIDLTGMLQVNNVRLLDAAIVPIEPYSPNWKKNLLAGFVLGMFLAFSAAILLDILDTSFKTQEDVESILRLPFLGVMPILVGDHLKHKKGMTPAQETKLLQERDLYILRHPKSMPAECSRAIRTNLLFMSPDKPLKSILVTSAMPKEGKTTTAIGLATTMAYAGSRVLIIDTDMRRPRLHRSFGVANEIGISSLIVNEATIEKAVVRSDLPNLDVLVCGPIPPNPAELLHTERFRELLKEFEERYDKVVFDAPPVGAVTDPVILGTQVDGTVLVVRTGITAKETVLRATRSLLDARAHVFGVILNDIDLTAKKYGYYYGKYYRYGRYYGQYGEGLEAAKAA